MLTPIVIVLALFAAAFLFAFAYLMDKMHGAALLLALVVWVGTMQPTYAAAPAASDADWPSMREQMQPLKYAYNILGDKVVLFANFCAGDKDRDDHMHVFGVYNSRGTFVAGGCWKFNPTNKARIEFFDLNGAGWSSWPRNAFEPTRFIDSKCRGESGDNPDTLHYCRMRDAI